VFSLLGSFPLSEIAPLAPRVERSESSRQENLKAVRFFVVVVVVFPVITFQCAMAYIAVASRVSEEITDFLQCLAFL